MRFVQMLSRKSLTEKSFEYLRKSLQKSSIPIIVIIFPVLGPDDFFNPAAAEKFKNNYPHLEIHSRIGHYAQKQGFFVLDLLPAFLGGGMSQLANDCVHPNAEGHQLTAETIARFLQKTRLLHDLPDTEMKNVE